MPDLRTPLRLLAPILGAVLTASACGGDAAHHRPHHRRPGTHNHRGTDHHRGRDSHD